MSSTPTSTWSPASHCYLCGNEHGEDSLCNVDHVPPKRVFPKALRMALPAQKLNLLTIKAHIACQQPYQRDEEYFYNTLLPSALQAKVGPLIADDFTNLIGRDSPSAKLSQTVKRQFEERPGGLVLPRGMLVQRVEGNRLHLVVWKIVRGLFTHHTSRFIPETTARFIKGHGPFDGTIPDYMQPLVNRAGRGHTREAFSYEFADSDEVDGWDTGKAHWWLLNFWETHLYFVCFHDPDCACENCREYLMALAPAESVTSGK
jgi:hypothetical protein